MIKTLVGFFILCLVVGFPRFYGTELPMAIILAPFYFAGFISFVIKYGKSCWGFFVVYFSWLLFGIVPFVFGGAALADVFFHIVLSSKILLNFFFGYVVFRVVDKTPKALAWWLFFQVAIVTMTLNSRAVYDFLLFFISPRSADVFGHIYGLRSIGFGLYHVDGAIILVTMFFYNAVIVNKGRKGYWWGLLLAPLSMSMARSALVALGAFILLVKNKKIKAIFGMAAIVFCVLSFTVDSGPIYQATEIVRLAFSDEGNTAVSSFEYTKNMYFLPDNFETYLYGDGFYFSSYGYGLEFYQGTDVGYLRLLFYSGAIYLLGFMVVNMYFPGLILLNKLKTGSGQIKPYSVALMLIFMVINFKGLQVMPVVAFALFWHARRNKSGGGGKALSPKVNK